MNRGFLIGCLIHASAVMQLAGYLDSLSDFVSYAAKIPENPKNESVEVYRPRFSKLYTSIAERTKRSLLSRIGFNRNRLIDEFNIMLRRSTRLRELEGAYGDFVRKYSIESETRWFIWSSLHGAFHSLLRALVELKKLHMLDEDLTFIDHTIYFVFNGNLINYGPYQIETLLLILKLVERNPKRILLIKGDFEQEDRWRKTTLVDELRSRIPSKKGIIPLEKQLSAFFKTFTLGAYLVSTELDVVRISFAQEHPLLKEESWGAFFMKKGYELRKLKYITEAPIPAKIRSLIITYAVEEAPSKVQSVVYKRERDMHIWELFSSPVNLFQAYYNFADDSLLALRTGRYFPDWVVTLYARPAEGHEPFKRVQEFDLATGRELFSADPEKRVEDLAERVELAEIEQQELEKTCQEKRAKQRMFNEKEAVQK